MVTTNLETSQAIAWDMGAIAQSGQVQLFRAVLRASSAIPGLFPPVEITYRAQGRSFREIHVDGGVTMQFLAVPMAALEAERPLARDGHLYGMVTSTSSSTIRSLPRHSVSVGRRWG